MMKKVLLVLLALLLLVGCSGEKKEEEIVTDGFTIDSISDDVDPYSHVQISKGSESWAYVNGEKVNDRAWRRSVYVQKMQLKTKRCSHCKEHLPATDEFFTVDEGKPDMYHGRCKKCRNRVSKEKRKRVSKNLHDEGKNLGI